MDLSDAIFTVRRDLRYTMHTDGPEPAYVLEDPLSGRFFRVGPAEYAFISRLNGKASFKKALTEQNRTGDPMGPDQAFEVLKWLMSQQLMAGLDEKHLDSLLLSQEKRRNLTFLSRINPVSFKFPLFNPDRMLKAAAPWLSWLNSRFFLACWALAAILALYVLAGNWPRFVLESGNILSPEKLLLSWVILFGLKIVHETAHALAIHEHGGQVRETGLLFILFIPLTYVDAASSWRFPLRWQRIHAALAGIYVELFMAAVCVFIWAELPGTTAAAVAHQTILVAGVSTVLFNANPLMRFDGYYALSDLTGTPNLYAQGVGFAASIIPWLFLGTPLAQPRHTGYRGWFIRAYGVAALIWKVGVLSGLMFGAAVMFQGWGVIMAAVAGLLWVGLPLLAFGKRIVAAIKESPRRLGRVLLVLLLAGLASLGGWFLSQGRGLVTCPAVVQYRDQAMVRALTQGFVRQVLVSPGQEVVEGQPLFVLENPELDLELGGVRDRIQTVETTARIYMREDRVGEAQALREELKPLAEKEAALVRDLENLTVRAPLDGKIVGSDLDTLLGVYLKKGDELVTVADDGMKLILASVSQDDVDTVRKQVGGPVTVDMGTAGLGRFTGTLKRVSPTALLSAPHPSLTAPYGGPLDVRPSEHSSHSGPSNRYDLVTPRFTAEVEIPEGMLGRVRIGLVGKVVFER